MISPVMEKGGGKKKKEADLRTSWRTFPRGEKTRTATPKRPIPGKKERRPLPPKKKKGDDPPRRASKSISIEGEKEVGTKEGKRETKLFRSRLSRKGKERGQRLHSPPSA